MVAPEGTDQVPMSDPGEGGGKKKRVSVLAEGGADEGEATKPSTNSKDASVKEKRRKTHSLAAGFQRARGMFQQEDGDDEGGAKAPELGNMPAMQMKANELIAHRKFTVFIASMIALNGLYIGVETDASDPTSSWWRIMEFGFTSVFLAELILRFYAERLLFFFDGWNNFDFFLVTIACVDTYILSLLESEDDNFNVFSILRILRLARLARIFRLLRFFKELWLLVTGVLDAMRTLVWAWMLMLLLIYIFGILVTRTLGITHRDEDPEMEDFFGNVPKSMFTLFQVMTTEGWADIARSAMKHQPWSLFLFILYLSVTTFAIMNVVVAVIVENTLDQAVNQKDELMKKAEAEKQAAMGKILGFFGRTALVAKMAPATSAP